MGDEPQRAIRALRLARGKELAVSDTNGIPDYATRKSNLPKILSSTEAKSCLLVVSLANDLLGFRRRWP